MATKPDAITNAPAKAKTSKVPTAEELANAEKVDSAEKTAAAATDTAAEDASVSEQATEAAEDAAEAAKDKEAQDKEARRVSEEKGQPGDPIKATFIRDSLKHETGPGDKTYKKGEVVEFPTQAKYLRWHRRNACETDADREVRLQATVAAKARNLRHQKSG